MKGDTPPCKFQLFMATTEGLGMFWDFSQMCEIYWVRCGYAYIVIYVKREHTDELSLNNL